MPAGFTADPVRWDEQTGLVTRAYRSPDALRGVEFRYGTRAAVETTVANPGTQLDPVTIDGSTATVRRYQDMYNDNVTVVWSSHGHRLALTVVGGSEGPSQRRGGHSHSALRALNRAYCSASSNPAAAW